MTFWESHEASEAEHAARKREERRAENEREILARHPDATRRICCRLRYAAEVCPEGKCVVIATTL